MFHTFWPVTTHSSPSRTALVCSDAMSEPAPGSENSWHHTSLPVAMPGRNRSFCSSVPCARIVGAARNVEMADTGPNTPRRSRSAATARATPDGRPLPNQRSGQAGKPQPERPMRSHHSPRGSSSDQFVANQSRASATTAAVASSGSVERSAGDGSTVVIGAEGNPNRRV